MTIYRYKSVTAQGLIQEGELRADTIQEVARHVQAQGSLLIKISPAVESTSDRQPWKRWFNPRIRIADLAAFADNMASLLSSGITLDQALSITARTETNSRLRLRITEIREALAEGSTLSDALSAFPDEFDGFFLSTVRGAERSGDLENGLSRLANHLKQQEAWRSQIVSALTYPALLLVVTLVSLYFLLIWVVPSFEPIFAESDVPLPRSTSFLIGLSTGAANWGWAAFVLLGTLLALFSTALRTPAVRMKLDRMLVRLPWIGYTIVLTETCRIARSLSTALQGGVPLVQATELSASAAQNYRIINALKNTAHRLSAGDPFVPALKDSFSWPPLLIQLVEVGDATGQLHKMLDAAASRLEILLRRRLERAITLIEPSLIVLLGLTIGFIIISVLMGIMTVNDLPAL